MPRLTPHLIIADCPRAIDFYKQVFDARELSRYADAKLGVAGVVLTDDLIGEHALVQGVAGVRLGMELARGSDQPQGRTRTFESHFTVSATGVPGAITWSFALGMDWGR